MTKLPRITGRKLIKVLRKHGFVLRRIRGSHYLLEYKDGRKTTVPVHRSEILRPGLLVSILKECDIDTKKLKNLL
jgi:predicted RNA binding protein YcfA (HicA-like mRNA interferase family)